MMRSPNKLIEPSGHALSPREVAELLGVSRSFVYDQIAAGRLPHLRVGARRIVIEREQLERFLALQRHTANAAAAMCDDCADDCADEDPR